MNIDKRLFAADVAKATNPYLFGDANTKSLIEAGILRSLTIVMHRVATP